MGLGSLLLATCKVSQTSDEWKKSGVLNKNGSASMPVVLCYLHHLFCIQQINSTKSLGMLVRACFCDPSKGSTVFPQPHPSPTPVLILLLMFLTI